jgi:hypothetical protein
MMRAISDKTASGRERKMPIECLLACEFLGRDEYVWEVIAREEYRRRRAEQCQVRGNDRNRKRGWPAGWSNLASQMIAHQIAAGSAKAAMHDFCAAFFLFILVTHRSLTVPAGSSTAPSVLASSEGFPPPPPNSDTTIPSSSCLRSLGLSS